MVRMVSLHDGKKFTMNNPIHSVANVIKPSNAVIVFTTAAYDMRVVHDMVMCMNQTMMMMMMIVLYIFNGSNRTSKHGLIQRIKYSAQRNANVTYDG